MISSSIQISLKANTNLMSENEQKNIFLKCIDPFLKCIDPFLKCIDSFLKCIDPFIMGQ